MHARATGGGKANERNFLFDGGFNAAHKTLAHNRAHAAAHEVKLEASGHHVDAVNGAAHDHQGVGFTGVAHGFFDALGVLAAVFEFQSVDRDHFLANFVAAFVVQKVVQTGTCANAVVVTAGGANVLVLLQVSFVKHGFALGALDPQAFRHAAAVGRVGVQNFWGKQFFEPTHVEVLMGCFRRPWPGECHAKSRQPQRRLYRGVHFLSIG